MFLNALIINVLLILFYGTVHNGSADYAAHPFHSSEAHFPSHEPVSSPTTHRYLSSAGTSHVSSAPDQLFILQDISEVVLALTSMQALCALLTVVIFFVVQVPVRFAAEKESTENVIVAGLFSLLDPLTIWYGGYLVMTILALEVNPLFVTVLLLDWIILDSTSQDLLNAIFVPARQLVATLTMILITLNIFSFVVFVLFRHDVMTFQIHNLWETLKLCISYGFRGEYGVDHEMEPTIGPRMILDVMFYFTVSFNFEYEYLYSSLSKLFRFFRYYAIFSLLL